MVNDVEAVLAAMLAASDQLGATVKGVDRKIDPYTIACVAVMLTERIMHADTFERPVLAQFLVELGTLVER